MAPILLSNGLKRNLRLLEWTRYYSIKTYLNSHQVMTAANLWTWPTPHSSNEKMNWRENFGAKIFPPKLVRTMMRDAANAERGITADFIKENLSLTTDHLTPEMKLFLLTEKDPLYNAVEGDETHPLVDPWWAFYWPGGQVLARFILDHPDVVKDQHVLDLGSGCGATSIACARAGAKSVVANDIDLSAGTALSVNLEANEAFLKKAGPKTISFSDINLLQPIRCSLAEKILRNATMLLVGDMLYDDAIGGLVWDLCAEFLSSKQTSQKTILLGDPGRWVLKQELGQKVDGAFHCVAKYRLDPTTCKNNHGFQTGLVLRSNR